MNSQDLIPIPASLKWREFRVRLLPVIVFTASALVVGWLWRNSLNTVQVVGSAEGKSFQLSIPSDGQVNRVWVKRGQTVQKGDPLIEILPASSQLRQATLSRIQAEAESLQASFEPASDLQRNALDVEQLMLDQLNTRVEKAQAQANAIRAARELDRIKNLHEQGISSTSDLDLAQATYDALQVEVEEKANYLESLGTRIEKIRSMSNPETGWESAMQSAIQVKQAEVAEVEAALHPITLYAPEDGVTLTVDIFEGQWVQAGEPGIEIINPKATQVIGYLREPLSEQVQPGDKVEIRTLRANAQVTIATIDSIGPSWTIIPARLIQNSNISADVQGLPIYITPTEELEVAPGEKISIGLYSNP